MEAMWVFLNEVTALPGIVWTIAFIMTFTTGWILHFRLEDFLRTLVICFGLYWTIVFAYVGMDHINLIFSDDKEANVVWVSGATICMVTALFVILARIAHVTSDFLRRLRPAHVPQIQALAPSAAPVQK